MRDALRAVAVRACERAGTLTREEFRTGRLDGDYSATDAKTALDRAAEDRAVETITETFPDHAIRAEESGDRDGGPYEWIVDPLDGTNNVAAGIPLFAAAVCVRDDDGPVLSVVHEPLPGDRYVAERGEGATVNGESISAGTHLDLDSGTVSFVMGYDAIGDPDRRERADAIRADLEAGCKRVLVSWAPCIDWGLLARGRIEAIVTYHPDVWEQDAGTLLAREAGVAIHEDGPFGIYAADEATLESVRETVSVT
jgi:myo-inositol-1(or 4)-monophosphatase